MSKEQHGEILLEGLRAGERRLASRHWCETETALRPPPQLGANLFHGLVYDTMHDVSSVPSRRCEEEALLSLLGRFAVLRPVQLRCQYQIRYM